ncbi:MAG: DUF4389 domain-containing protein [Solirubrobacterales bacterium]|nr:DUF4389 domain-containing protein [Solirubrobacterales bacterium]
MYPVTYEADYLKERNRLTTFFRYIVAIPWIIVAYAYMIAALVVIFIAWFALLFTGRYPEGMYNFVGGILRFTMRVQGFLYLQTDAWPSFGLKDDPAYPVRVHFAPRAAKQSRVSVFFRLILLVPLLLLSYLVSTLLSLVAAVSWVTIVFRGYQPAAIHNALAWALSWTTRVNAYAYLMRDEYPPVGDEIPVNVNPPAIEEQQYAAVEAGQQHEALDPVEAEKQDPPPPAPPAV